MQLNIYQQETIYNLETLFRFLIVVIGFTSAMVIKLHPVDKCNNYIIKKNE